MQTSSSLPSRLARRGGSGGGGVVRLGQVVSLAQFGHLCASHTQARTFVSGPTNALHQKKQTAAGYMASAGKVGGDEKWAQAAMEYIYEKNHTNDGGRKRQHDVDQERGLAEAYDRYAEVNEKAFDERLGRLTARMSGALEAIRDLGLAATLDEAVLLNSEQPPNNYRRPTLTPPLPSYEPAFGLDVPQLKSQQAEYPAVVRPSDAIEFSPDASEEDRATFPFVDAHQVEDLTKNCAARLEAQHSAIRATAPLTGVEGEAWEAYVALQKRALARQTLLFDLHNDPVFQEEYNKSEAVRQAEWVKRGLVPLAIEDPLPRDVELHFAQEPAYEPFRKM